MALYLGIDLGHSSVRAVVLRTAYRRIVLEAVGEVELARFASVADAVKEVAGPFARRCDGVAVCLGGEHVVWRRMEIPAAAQKQLANIVPFELEAQLPFDLDDSVLDFRVLPRDGAEIPVLAAVARVADVKRLIDLIRLATSTEPEVVVPGAFSLTSLVPWVVDLAVPGPLLLIDLGAIRTEVLVLVGGEPVFARTLSAGTQGLPASASLLARELRQTLGAWRATGGAPVDQLYVVGGGAGAEGAEAFLAGELHLPVRLLPVPRIEGISAELAPTFSRFAKATALALAASARGRVLNLRRGVLSYERGYGFLRDRVPVLAGLAAVILVSFLFSTWAEMHALSKEKETLENALVLVSQDVLGEETRDAARAVELLEQGSSSDEDPLPRADAFDVLVKLTEAVPPELVHDLEELDVQRTSPQAASHVVIHGVVPKVQDAETVVTGLKNFRCFQDVKIIKTSQQIGADGQKYHLEFDLRCPDDKKPNASPASAASAAAAASGKEAK